MRYPVETLLELLSSGMTHDEIVSDYEDLERDDLLAVLVTWLVAAGCNAVHALDLPEGNRTTDAQIIDLADHEKRVVVTKDADSVDSHLLAGRPAKLLLISTGNISNRAFEVFLAPLFPDIVREFRSHSFLEVDTVGIIVRR